MSAVEILPGGGRRIEVVLYIGGDLVGTTATSDPGERALLMQYLKGDPGDSEPVPGPAGPTGPAGAAGATGSAGPAGTTGAAGAAGATGPAGPQGPPGEDSTVPGPAGAAGSAGVQGMQGEPGEPGATGSAGAAGSTGATGSAGATGATGPQGEPGDDGAPGATGTAGAAGAQGIQGVPGDVGATGATGPAGATGATGADGAPGAGVATGGTVGQYLRKVDSTNYNTAWASFSAKFTSFDGLTVAAGNSLYFTDANTAAVYATTLAGRNLSNVAGTINLMYYLSATDTWSSVTTTTGGRALLAATGVINTVPYFSAANVISPITTSANSRAVLGAATYAAINILLGVGTTAVEQRSLPEATTAANYTFVALDAGKTKLKAAADTTARNWTVNNAVHTAGDFISGINNQTAGNVTLLPGSGVTLKTLGTGTTAASGYSVPPGCSFTVWMETAAIGWVSGIGVTAL